MGLDAIFQQIAYAGYQVWAWLRYESGVHPVIFLGAVLVIVAAIILYKTEIRTK
jgi:hypothetical protein